MGRVTPAVTAELERILGREHVSVSSLDRAVMSRDVWPRTTIQLSEGELPLPPEAVVWPGTVEEVQALVRLAAEEGIPLIPMGGGSGVCGGTAAVGGRGIIVDLKRLNLIRELDETSLTVTAEAGIIGEVLERWLNQHGYTLGHFPSSIYCSSYGGWLCTRAAGQLSAKYGKIEDMVISVEMVLPSGEILETPKIPRPGPGVEWKELFVGAEGTLGIITAATCRLWPYPRSRRFQAFTFERVEDGLAAVRTMLQEELRPAAIRLYDPVDTFFSRLSRIIPAKAETEESAEARMLAEVQEKPRRTPSAAGKSSLARKMLPRLLPFLAQPAIAAPLISRLQTAKLILTFEGDPDVTLLEKSMARGICARFGARDLGSGPARHWWEKRYKVSYAMSTLFALGMFVDTIEVASTWENLINLYYGMRAAIAPHAFVMAHFSHAYPHGCSIYFSIAAPGRNLADKLARYDRVWEAALDACVAYGGTISHHHGVGILKARWLAAEHGAGSSLLSACKQALDPQNIMNPGKLGLGTSDAPISREKKSASFPPLSRPLLSQSVSSEEKTKAEIEIQPINQTVRAAASVRVGILEMHLNAHGFTLGRMADADKELPLGQWLHRHGRRTLSPKTPPLAAQILSLNSVLPNGSVFHSSASPRRAAGPNLDKLILSAAGEFGTITSVLLGLSPLPGWQSELYLFSAPDFAAGIEALRLLMREGFYPAAVEFCDSHFFRTGSESEWGTSGEWELRLLFAGTDQPLPRLIARNGVELCGKILGPASRLSPARFPSATEGDSRAPANLPSLRALGALPVRWSRVTSYYQAAWEALSKYGEPAVMVNEIYPTGAVLSFYLFSPPGRMVGPEAAEAARAELRRLTLAGEEEKREAKEEAGEEEWLGKKIKAALARS